MLTINLNKWKIDRVGEDKTNRYLPWDKIIVIYLYSFLITKLSHFGQSSGSFYRNTNYTTKQVDLLKEKSSALTMVTQVQDIVRNADAVCFDVDSTVIKEEGIDELAKFCGKGNEVAELTARAMHGQMTFQEALKIRLDIIKPKLTQIKDFIKTQPPTLSPGIKKLVALLHSRKIPVYLISGGFKSIIAPIASQLNIPHENIFANRLTFYFNGDYAGFDASEPTSRSGGKAVVISHLKETKNYQHLVLIGDGATDLEACPPADGFIGYGGNVIRPIVQSKAKWFVTDFNEIMDIFK